LITNQATQASRQVDLLVDISGNRFNTLLTTDR
jgi:hypothetical protein